MNMYITRISMILILLIANTTMFARVQENNPVIEDIDVLLKNTKRMSVIESIDYAYVRHPVLCTIGFTVFSFVMLYLGNPEVRKRVHAIIGMNDEDDSIAYIEHQ